MGNQQTNDWEYKKKARSNQVVGICYLIELALISIAYVAEVFKGARTVPYVLVVLVLCIVPLVAEFAVYKKDKASPIIKHIIGIGFALLYIYVMVTTNNPFTFVYVIPMVIAITVYDDSKYSLCIDIGMIIVNILQIVLFFKKGIYTADNSAQIEIQILVIILIGSYMVYTSRALERNNADERARMAEHQAYIEEMLENIMNVSAQMTSNIDNVDAKVIELRESMDATSEAMNEVNSGAMDTADAVQKQLIQTENIQQRVQAVSEGAKNIMSSMANSKQAIDAGNSNIDKLVEQVKNSVESGSIVNNELGTLDEYMSQMNSIIDLINGITSQTSLLALNASIEAARAGEAGKGFAVVASEISQMANQTQDATVRITELIDNVSQAIERVIKVSQNMIDMIKSQNAITTDTAQSFKLIDENAINAYKNSESLALAVEELGKANREIIDSISTISAISEEVAAHANDTTESSVNNNKIVEDVNNIANALKELAKQLNEQNK